MNRKTFLQTLLGLPAIVGLAKTVHAEPRSFNFNPNGGGVPWTPRPQRNIIYGPRRSGKTTAAAVIAADAFAQGKRIFYGAPNLEQAEKFGAELTKAYHPPFDRNGYVHVARITDVASGRGFNADLVILDEFQEMDYMVWPEVFAPMLLDNHGDALLIYQGDVLPGRFSPEYWGMIRMGFEIEVMYGP